MITAVSELLPEGGIFVSGKPLTDIWGPPGLRWIDKLTVNLPDPLLHPFLVFTRNDKAHFDLDNLAHPVLHAAGTAQCESVWALLKTGGPEGVQVREAVPPLPPVGDGTISVHIAHPSTGSVVDRDPVPELSAVTVFGRDEPVGLALQFDSPDVAVGELSYEGPVKSLIDDLGPLLGHRELRGRMEANDERVRELRITRGHDPERAGVAVTLWRL